ncbi:MAG: helix-turn-helix domain-containing protein, partial [Pseudomonadota bacterium]
MSSKQSFKSNTVLPETTSPTISWALWMLQLLQGVFDQNELIRQFSAILPRQEVIDLYSCILNEPLKIRNRAIAILALFRGLPKKDISKYLCIHRSTLDEYIKRYKAGGVNRLLFHKTVESKKYQIPKYSREIFAILH